MPNVTLVAPGPDPVVFGLKMWPHVRFYDKQVEIIRSVRDNTRTFVQAGNELGKDFVAGYAALSCLLCPTLYFPELPNLRPEVRVVTTSVKDDHLRVLWGEIGRFIQTCSVPLLREQGGPLVYNHRDVRKMWDATTEDEISYLRGMVSEHGEGMAGHHANYTLMIIDEASGVEDVVYTQGQTWAKRILAIGNPNHCANFFYRECKAGDLPATE